MVSKICELLEDLDNAEDLCNYIEKWGKYLEIKDKNTELDKLIVHLIRKKLNPESVQSKTILMNSKKN